MHYARWLIMILVLGISAAVVPVRSQSDEDWGAEETDARRREIIGRYRSLLERRPVEGTVLERLLQEVGGGRAFERLLEDYERLAAEDPLRYAYPMILGHLYKRAGRLEDAIAAYQTAATIEPDEVLPLRSMADALYRAGRVEEAQATYLSALERAGDEEDREEILFALADIAFEQRDFQRAAEYFEQIIELDPRDVYIRMQWADTLREHGQLEEAIRQYQAIVDLSGRDTRQRALNLGSIGDVLVELERFDGAIERYREAQRYVRRASWLYQDLEVRIIEAYRASGDLVSLVAEYENRWRRPDFDQMCLLGELYAEVGRINDALGMYTDALRRDPGSVEARLDLIQLLERLGRWDDVIAQYQQLIRRSGESQHRFRLAEILKQTGDEAAAREVLRDIEREYRRNPGVLVSLADVYLRWGERDRAREIYGHLADLEPNNPDFLIVLGEFQFMEGRREEALATWQRLVEVVPDGSLARAMLAQVYAEHGMYEESIATYRQAVDQQPEDEDLLRSYAEVLEEARRFSQALSIYGVLSQSGSDSEVRAHARSRIIALVHQQGLLRDRLADYVIRFQSTPPDREAGYFLGEAYTVLGELDEAELVFLALLEIDDQDLEVLIPLARMYQEIDRLPEAIDVLRRIAQLSPDWARDYYYQIAELSLRLFQDEQAIDYATRAVALNPADARGHARLGDIYLRMQQYDRAVTSYQEAVRLGRRGSPYNLDLAAIYRMSGRLEEADELYRTVVRYNREPAVILRAGEMAIQINAALGTLEALQAEWEPLVFRPHAQTETRELLVELHQRLVFPLVRLVRTGSREEAIGALMELERLGVPTSRSLIPILADEDRHLALASLQILAELPVAENAEAIARLLADPDDEIRLEATLVLGRLGDPGQVVGLVSMCSDEQPMVRTAAVWALGQIGEGGAADSLMTLLAADPAPDVRAMAAISLGMSGHDEALIALLEAVGDTDPGVERAALWALGAMGDAGGVEVLIRRLSADRSEVRAAAASSLGGMPSDEPIIEGLLRTYWGDEDSQVRLAAGFALRRLGASDTQSGGSTWEQRLARYRPHRETLLDRSAFLAYLESQTLADLPETGSLLVTEYGDTIESILSEILLSEETPVVSRALESLMGRPGGVELGLITWQLADYPGYQRAADRLGELGERLIPILSDLAIDSETSIQCKALQLLAQIGPESLDGDALEFLFGLLADRHPQVRRLTALVLGRSRSERVPGVLRDHLDDGDCLVRAAVAESLGRSAGDSIVSVLMPVFQADVCILARGGAARGLVYSGSSEAVDVLIAGLETNDPLMRAEIVSALEIAHNATAQSTLQELLADPSPVVREAARHSLAQ